MALENVTYPRQVFEDGAAPGDPASPTVSYVIYKLSTGEVLNSDANYPRQDGMEISGGDPDLVHLRKTEPFPAPDYDSRNRSLVVTQPDPPATPPTAEQLSDGEWPVTYSTQVRAKEQRALSVDNREQQEALRHFGNDRAQIDLIKAVGYLIRVVVEGQTLVPKREKFLKAFRRRALSKISANEDLARQLKDAVFGSDDEPDYDGTPWAEPGSAFTVNVANNRLLLDEIEEIENNGNGVTLSSDGTLPTPFEEGKAYFVINLTGTGCKLAASPGAGEIDITDAGTGTHTILRNVS